MFTKFLSAAPGGPSVACVSADGDLNKVVTIIEERDRAARRRSRFCTENRLMTVLRQSSLHFSQRAREMGTG